MDSLTTVLPVIFSLVLIEGLLSVDNAMVIASMVSHLPEKQRSRALRFGLLGAYGFRLLALFSVTLIIANPWVRLLGAGYLVYLMCKHLGCDAPGEHSAKTTAERGFWGTVLSIQLADLAFALDNVVAAVALSRELLVVVIGVMIGMATMFMAARLFVGLVKKYPILEQIAYVLVGFVGMALFVEEIYHVHVTVLEKTIALVGIIGFGLLYERIRLLRVILGPVFGWISRVMGDITELIDSLLWPATTLARGTFKLAKGTLSARKKN